MANMRLPITLFTFLLTICFTAHSANGDPSFTLVGATGKTYKQFIKNLREALTKNSQQVYSIPVLPPTGSSSAGFLSVDLTNYNGETISLGINNVNVYVVGFRTGSTSYFLQDIPKEARSDLFPGTDKKDLTYSGTYDRLETAAKTTREKLDLGFSAISSAIGNMYYYEAESVPKAFLVLIQTVAEAARFKYIESRVSQEATFRPDPAFLSLENRWSDLSEQIQLATKNGGKFVRPVEVRSVSNNPIEVTDVSSDVVKGVALLLYYKVSGSVAMPCFVRVLAADGNSHRLWI